MEGRDTQGVKDKFSDVSLEIRPELAFDIYLIMPSSGLTDVST